MPPADLPAADIAGAACAQVPAAGADGAAIDWRQLSHELRTPLNAILGNAELLLDGSTGPLSTQARACLGEIQVAGRALLRHVRLLLAWSELCAGRPRLAECRVDLIALIREALADTSPAVVRIEPHDATLPISGDRFWLHMLVAEIIALPTPSSAAPTLAFARSADAHTLRFTWPDFGAAQTDALHRALIEGIARLQGAAVVSYPDGLSLCWPLQRLDWSGAIAPGSEQGCGPGTGQSHAPTRPAAWPISSSRDLE
jgi:hypothetical protein